MVQSFRFAVVRLSPEGVRDERVNVGAVVFSDDAVDVQLPKVNNLSSSEAGPALQGNMTSMAAAVHLFELRKCQSVWYQNLYHTGSEPSPNPRPDYMLRRQQLESWLQAMPTSISKANKDWLTLEWHYLYVYASAPCPKVPQPAPHW